MLKKKKKTQNLNLTMLQNNKNIFIQLKINFLNYYEYIY